MSTTNNVDLNFKYGTGELPGITSGSVYIKKIADAKEGAANGRARIYIDSPETNSKRLEIGGGDVYVGKSSDSEAKNYDVVIDPDGDVINNIVTSETSGGYIIRVVETTSPDAYDITKDNPNSNVITLVIQK